MCGIAGLVSKDKNKKENIEKMSEIIKHRGPDGEGYYIDDDVAFVHRRLAIIDLSGGGQPIYNEKKDMVIVFNGEIYNYIELRSELKKLGHKFKTKTDTEVIIHGYEEWGKKVTSRLRGMFAFAIWDSNKKELFMARDGFGIKPLYYTKMKDTFMFASEIKAFLDHPDFEKKLNKEILAAYLCFNSCPTTESFFKGVYRLEPGTQLSYKNGKYKIEKFFQLTFDEKDKDFNKCVEDIKKVMKDSVIHHQISDVEVGSFLSSGIDSSYLVSLAKPDRTYTVGYDDPRYDEISYAKELTKKLGIKNTSHKITKDEYFKAFPEIMYYMDEPLADPSAIALYFVAKIASKDVKVVMSGEGADELFGGYLSYMEELDQAWYMKIPYPIRHVASKVASILPDVRGLNFIYRRGMKLEDYNIGLGRVFRDSEARSLVKSKNQIKTKDIVADTYKIYSNNSNLVKRQAIDFYYWLVKDFLHAVDRNTMIFGLEARTPFLDLEVYNVARSLPSYAKIQKGVTKPALREAAKEVIPTEAYKKKKLGFPVPLREWIKDDDIYNMIKVKFESDSAKELFNQKKILKLLENRNSKRKDTYKKIWTVYTFLVWYDIYFAS